MRDGEEGREHPGLVGRGGVNHSCWTLVLKSDATRARASMYSSIGIGQTRVSTPSAPSQARMRASGAVSGF